MQVVVKVSFLSLLNLVQRLSNLNVCALSAVHIFLSGAFLGNRMLYLDDIWYVGGARAEGMHAEFWAWHMLINHLICLIYSKKLSTAFLGNCMPYLVLDIWYVGRARAGGAHVEFLMWHMLVPWDQKC